MEEKNIIDLGHDDLESKAAKDGRSRTWMLLLYEDDPTHKRVLDGVLNDLDWDYAGRIHDQDSVKDHYHIVCVFKDGRKNKDVAADLGIDKRWLRAWDKKKKAFRYLCHKDNPEKFQYSVDGIFGTVSEKAISECLRGDSQSEQQSVFDIISLLDSCEGFVSFSNFIYLANERGLYATFRRMGNLGVSLINEHNAKVRLKYDNEMKSDERQEDFVRFLRSIDDLPFERRCEILAKKGYPPLKEN